MKSHLIKVTRGDEWLIGRHADEPTFTTQGKDLDELVFMIRDAIDSLTDEQEVEIDLRLPPELTIQQPAA